MPLPGMEYLLNPATVMDKFVHLGNYFKKSDEGLKREACLAIIRIPTFLYLLADIMKKQIEGMYLSTSLIALHSYMKLQPKLPSGMLNMMSSAHCWCSTASRCGSAAVKS